MRGLAKIGVISLAASLLGAAAANADSGALQPYEMVRSLEALQDQIVLGNQVALAAQPKLVRVIGERFASASLQDWHDPKNVRAALVYILSGGRPQAIASLLSPGLVPQEDQKIVKGALAYVEGHENEAKQLLSDIDARNLAPGLGGYVAFAQAKLFSQDRRKTMHYLDIARLLAPGTLVEEAALRREVFLADDTGDVEKFVFLSRQYIQRFQKSLYAADFRQRFASAIIHLGLSEAPGMAERLDDLLKELSVDDQRVISLMIARAGVLDGKTAAVRFAVARGERLTAAGSVEEQRLWLYDAAALILSKGYDQGLERLQQIQRSRLPPSDALLLDAVSAVAQRIGKWSDAAQPAAGDAQPKLAQNQLESSAQTVIDLAESSLAQADRALKESAP